MQRCDGITPPDYYRAPLRRPRTEPEAMQWDMERDWITTAEWLAWVRRARPGDRILARGRWVRPPRPIIGLHWQGASTGKVRRLV